LYVGLGVGVYDGSVEGTREGLLVRGLQSLQVFLHLFLTYVVSYDGGAVSLFINALLCMLHLFDGLRAAHSHIVITSPLTRIKQS